MISIAKDPVARAIVACAILLLGSVHFYGSREQVCAAAAGCTLALLNWIAVRFTGVRLLHPDPGIRLLAIALITLKLTLLLALCWLIVGRLELDPMAFGLGLGTLLGGVLIGAARWAARVEATQSEET